MKALLVGGGLVDFATLHPLWTLAAAVIGVVVARRAVRSLGAGRQPRSRPPPGGAESDGPGRAGGRQARA